MKNKNSSTNSYSSQTVDRALSILFTFYENPEIESLTSLEISEYVNLPHSTVFRLLSVLLEWGLVEKNDKTKQYRLGVTCLRLGSAYLAKNNLRTRASRFVKKLRDETGETIHLAVRDGAEAVYLEKFDGLHPIGVMSSRVGGRSPIHCTAVGKVLLAYIPPNECEAIINQINFYEYTKNTITDIYLFREELEQIRKNGYGVDNEEHENDVACLAAPIFNHEGQVVSALSISGPVERIFNQTTYSDLAVKVKNYAREISVAIGGGMYLN